MKINEFNMKNENDNKKYIENDYKLILLIFSIIFILIIIYFNMLLSDVFIRFINKYTIIGKYLDDIKTFFKTENKNIINMKGGGITEKQNDFYIINNDLPLSDYSDVSSIEF